MEHKNYKGNQQQDILDEYIQKIRSLEKEISMIRTEHTKNENKMLQSKLSESEAHSKLSSVTDEYERVKEELKAT